LRQPFFVVFGRLSDRVGRKKIVLIGCLLAALTYFPIFRGITHFANPAIESASQRAPVRSSRSRRLQLSVRSGGQEEISCNRATSQKQRSQRQAFRTAPT